MDITTLIGLVIGVGLIIFAIFTKQGTADYFWDYSSLLLVLGGTLAATMVNYPLKNIWRIFKVLKNVFRQNPLEYNETIQIFVDFAEKVRKKGIISLEADLDGLEDRFMRSAIELAINEQDTQRLRNYLNLELGNMERRHQMGQELFFYMGTYAPAFGMVGTIVGLVIMMKSYTMTGMGDQLVNSFEFDIAQKFRDLLSGMGMALLTTFYGLILSNLVFIPIGGKLKRRSEEEIMFKEIMIEGVICLHNRDHPLVVREKLNTFVPSTERVSQ